MNRAETQHLQTHTHISYSKIKTRTNGFRAFSLAEMMVVMLIISLIMAATMPLITKKRKYNAKNSISLQVKTVGDPCPTTTTSVAITADHISLLTCQSGSWTKIGGGSHGSFTSTTCGSGTWVAPFGVTSVDVTLLGGGGSGGTQSNDNYGVSGAGNGGGAGGYSKYTISVVPLASYSYVVGCGGTLPYTIGSAGWSGGDTSFGTTGINSYSALGGKGGGGGNGNDPDYVGAGGVGYTANGNSGLHSSGWVGGFGGAGGPNAMDRGGNGFLTLSW